MRILVCGGRDYDNISLIDKVLDAINAKYGIDVIIQGGASGADNLAYHWAVKTNISVRTYAADWYNFKTSDPVLRKYDKKGNAYNALAGINRNQKMIDEGQPDICIAFKGGPGTADMVRRCKDAKIKVIEVSF